MNDGWRVLLGYNPIVLTGAFGSGKTETALHLALMAPETEVVLVDLDLVTPYFRSRERRRELSERDITLLSPEGFHAGVELPVMPPAVGEAMERAERCIVDVGGGEVGMRTLGSLSMAVERAGASCILVVNPYRPGTGTREGIVNTARSLQQAGRVQFEGILANPHLGDRTRPEDIERGVEIVSAASAELGLSILSVGVGLHVVKQDGFAALESELARRNLPHVVIDPRMRPDWH